MELLDRRTVPAREVMAFVGGADMVSRGLRDTV